MGYRLAYRWLAHAGPTRRCWSLHGCSGPTLREAEEQRKVFQIAPVASFVQQVTLLKEWEKAGTCEVRVSGVHGPKNAVITRMPVLYSTTWPRSPMHFSDRTAFLCRCCLPPEPMRAASALRKT